MVSQTTAVTLVAVGRDEHNAEPAWENTPTADSNAF